MKLSKTLLASSVAAVMAAGVMAPAQAEVEVGASVGIASSYLWRGADLGSGTPAVSGDLNLSAGGFYGGVWVSSGDHVGTEYDIYAGYGGSVGDFSYDFSLVSYNYPTGPGYAPDGETDFTDWSDAVVSLGYGPVAFSAFIPVGDDNSPGDYMYYTLSAEMSAFSLLVGMHADNAGAVGCPADTPADETCDPIHVDLSYAYNDNLSFTLSQFIADETADDDLKVVVSYTLPLGE